VYKVQDRRTGGVYAVKKTKEYGDGISVTSIREVSVLRDCSESKNIVRLHEVCMGVDCVFMVLEYVPFDMGCVLNSIRGHPLPLSYTKTLFQQLLHGIAELHELGYMHRDIKMTNLLLSREGILKIADLGLARSIKTNIRWEEPDEAKLNSTALKLRHDVESEQEKAPRETPKEVSHRYTSTVVTLWYRAPEVLLGAGRYDEKLDIWSCGCILAEWLLVKPLLPGKSDIDQLERTVRLLGFPNQTAAPNLENVAQKHLLATIPQDITPATCPPTSEVWTGYFGKLDQVTQDFLSVLLSYDPARRPSAREALQHPFFTTAPLPADPRAVADQISSVYKPRKYDK
jgi:serine/threonine protein kinase